MSQDTELTQLWLETPYWAALPTRDIVLVPPTNVSRGHTVEEDGIVEARLIFADGTKVVIRRSVGESRTVVLASEPFHQSGDALWFDHIRPRDWGQ